MAESALCPSCMKRQILLEDEELLRRREEQRHRKIEKAKERAIPERYLQTDLKHPEFNRKLYDEAIAWRSSKATPWLGLIGETGRSKTRCASLILAASIEAGKSSQFASAIEMGRWVERSFDDDREERSKARSSLTRMFNAGVLVLDDLGKLRPTDAKITALYEILEERSKRNLPLIWTANSNPEEFTRSYQSEHRDPIAGRLVECSFIIDVG